MNCMKNICFLIVGFSLFATAGCKKYLDAKPNQALVVPATLADARALMDAYPANQVFLPGMAHSSNDDFYVTDDFLAGTSQQDRNIYLFTVTQEPVLSSAWLNNYAVINRSNLVIDLLKKLQVDQFNEKDLKDCLGHAYFLRACRLHSVAGLFALPYKLETAKETPGVPIRVTPDINEPTIRGTLEDTYKQIEHDLLLAIELLPAQPSAHYRPGRAAAFSLLAYVMLQKLEFGRALEYAQQSLALQNSLIDFNTINLNASNSFALYNPEVLYQAQVSGQGQLGFNNWRVDTLLYRSYLPDDLRKAVFFRPNSSNSFGFKGDMGGMNDYDVFTGITIGETYLMAAEAAARAGNAALAMNYLNTLLIKRFRTGQYKPYVETDAAKAFEIVRQERRKELVGRGLRWHDLRRWNFEGVTQVTIERYVNGSYYRLLPTSKNYVFEIPSRVIDLSGIAQNERE